MEERKVEEEFGVRGKTLIANLSHPSLCLTAHSHALHPCLAVGKQLGSEKTSKAKLGDAIDISNMKLPMTDPLTGAGLHKSWYPTIRDMST